MKGKARPALDRPYACSGIKAAATRPPSGLRALTPSARSGGQFAGDGTKNGLPAPNKERRTGLGKSTGRCYANQLHEPLPRIDNVKFHELHPRPSCKGDRQEQGRQSRARLKAIRFLRLKTRLAVRYGSTRPSCTGFIPAVSSERAKNGEPRQSETTTDNGYVTGAT